MLERPHRALRLKHWTHGDDAIERDPRGTRADGYADREVSAERLTHDKKPPGWVARVNAPDRVDDFIDAAGMEEILVEGLRVAVIAKIEPKYRVARLEEPGSHRQSVARVRRALPAVQENHEASRRLRARAVVAEQAHAIAAIDDLGLRATEKTCRAQPHGAPTPRQFGHNRLQVAVTQTERRAEVRTN